MRDLRPWHLVLAAWAGVVVGLMRRRPVPAAVRRVATRAEVEVPGDTASTLR